VKRHAIKPKPHNANTMTEGQYRQMVRSTLRGAFLRKWKPRNVVLKAASRPSTDPAAGRHQYQCAACGSWCSKAAVQVDHREPLGKLETWDQFIARLFVEAPALQVLCNVCHKAKTKAKGAADE
jgi:5-methylcytosine-specific restriction endonuclease McrA